jgi:hypothetical protein
LRHGRSRADWGVVEVAEHDPFDVTGAPAEELKRAGDDGALSAHPVSTTVTPSGPSHR